MKLNYLCGFLAVAASASLLASCGASSSEPEIDMIPVQLESDGNWSFYKPDGTIVYNDEFKNEPSVVIDGVFSVRENDHITLYKAGDKPTAVDGCEGLIAAGYVSDGLVPIVRPNERISVVSKSGEQKFVLEPVKGKEIVRSAQGFKCGRLGVANEDDQLGYFDTKGKAVIEPQFQAAGDFSEDLAVVGKLAADSSSVEYMVIDLQGKTVFKLHKDHVLISHEYSNGYLQVRDANEHVLLLDKKGEATKLPTKVVRVGQVEGDCFTFRNEDGEWGLMNLKGEVLIRAKYESISMLDNGTFLCEKEKSFEIVDKKGDAKQTFEDYRSMAYIRGFGLIGSEKRTFVFLDEEGKPRSKNEEFYGIGSNLSAGDDALQSDYVDLAAGAQSIVDQITATGFATYTFGETAADCFKGKEPEQYVGRNNVQLDDLSKKAYRYKTVMLLQFNSIAAMVDETYDYSNYSYSRTYAWNPRAKMEAGVFGLMPDDSSKRPEALKALTDALTKAGYKQVAAQKKPSENESLTVYKKGTVLVVVVSTNSAPGAIGCAFKEYPGVVKAYQEALANVDNGALSLDDINIPFTDPNTAEEVEEVAVADSAA